MRSVHAWQRAARQAVELGLMPQPPPPPPGAYTTDLPGTVSVAVAHECTQHDFERLTGCRFVAELEWQSQADRRSVDMWSMPPPCAPSMPFGSVPAAEAAGCAHELSTNIWPLVTMLSVRPAKRSTTQAICHSTGDDDAEAPLQADLGLGLFAVAPIGSGRALCEYTGVVRIDPTVDEQAADDYAYALPVCDPNVVISARDAGGVARCINHSDEPNCELRTVHHGGMLRVVCFTLRDLSAGEQCLIHYGEPYWRNERRRPRRVKL